MSRHFFKVTLDILPQKRKRNNIQYCLVFLDYCKILARNLASAERDIKNQRKLYTMYSLTEFFREVNFQLFFDNPILLARKV